MLFFHNEHCGIYFGTAEHAVDLIEIQQDKNFHVIHAIAQKLRLIDVTFLHQKHGVLGLYVQDDYVVKDLFSLDGDYIFTQKKLHGLGVLTADCVPIAFYDPKSHTAGMIHAGWKGLCAGVVQETIRDMQSKIPINLADCVMYLGPSARPCCYEVQQDFVDAFLKYENIESCFVKKNGKIYFDSRLFIIIIATNLGMNVQKIYTTYNVCTICDLSFCSYRRDKDTKLRQISMIFLK
jgi:YfiH family protein